MKIAGVTFANNDGTNRQTILESIGKGTYRAELVQAIFNGDNGPERAVEVWCKGSQIGYVPRVELNNPVSYEKQVMVNIDTFTDEQGNLKWYASLYSTTVISSLTDSELAEMRSKYTLGMRVKGIDGSLGTVSHIPDDIGTMRITWDNGAEAAVNLKFD